MARTKKNLDNEFSIGVFVLFRSFDDYCYWLSFATYFLQSLTSDRMSNSNNDNDDDDKK